MDSNDINAKIAQVRATLARIRRAQELRVKVQCTPAERRMFYALQDVLKQSCSNANDGQAWYWSDEFQEKEREADEDIERGDYEEFDNFDDFIDELWANHGWQKLRMIG